MIFKKKIVLPNSFDYQKASDLLLNDDSQLSQLELSHYLSTATVDNTLVIFIGGAMDDFYRPLYNGVFIPYRLEYHRLQDICYATHAATDAVIALINYWSNAGQKIIVVGHSWGGNSALRVARELPSSTIDLLVTLDPVSRRYLTRDLKKPANIDQWINVHIDYSKASMEYSNVVARLGGAWAHCPNADQNIPLSRDLDTEITHVMADRMFQEVINEIISL